MSATATLLTVEQFLQLLEKDGVRRELDEGMVIEIGTGGPAHEVVKARITVLLAAWAARTKRGLVFPETMFDLGPHTSFQPDVSWLSSEQLRSRGLERLLEGPPDLAVEVVSSETATHLEKKIEYYLRRGSRAVWAVFVEQRTVRVYRTDGSSQLLEGDQLLREPELLPEFQAKVSEFFEGV